MERTNIQDTTLSAPRDLTQGVIVVRSGGAFDLMNPLEVRDRMDQLILHVNADAYVLANTAAKGLDFKLFPDQQFGHIHQSKWPQICDHLHLLTRT